MSQTPYAPVIRTQADLEKAWRHLMEPLGFCDEPPTEEQEASLARLLGHFGPDARVVFLRSRPGRGGPGPDDLAWARSLYAACRTAAVPTEAVHLATDDTLVPLPMDEVLAQSA
jgi:hypothetical protein